MAFTTARIGTSVFGTLRVAWGTYVNADGSTGGDVDTGLTKVHFMLFQHMASAVVAELPCVYETMPCAGNAVTIVTTANDDGNWVAFGY